MVHEIQFMSEGRTIPWVRYVLRPRYTNLPTLTKNKLSVPGHDHAAMGFALDAGASLVIPQVNTVAEARHAISSAKFGARNNGTRSAPPFRLIPGISAIPSDPTETLHENLNRQAAIMIQIETVEAIDNLDAILTEVPEIDVVWPGMIDIRVSMGLAAPAVGEPEPEFVKAMAKFESVLRKHDKPRGGVALGPPEVMRELGKDNCISFIAADAMALMGLADVLPLAKEMFPAQKKMADAGEKVLVNGNGKMQTR